jgi:hypothetical protein
MTYIQCIKYIFVLACLTFLTQHYASSLPPATKVQSYSVGKKITSAALTKIRQASAATRLFAGKICAKLGLFFDKPLFIRLGHKLGINYNEPDSEGFTPLTLAAANGRTQAIKAMVELGANINDRDHRFKLTPLLWAAYYGQPKTAKILCDLGANKATCSPEGYTPLQMVFRRQNCKAATDLLYILLGGETNI